MAGRKAGVAVLAATTLALGGVASGGATAQGYFDGGRFGGSDSRMSEERRFGGSDMERFGREQYVQPVRR
jgi:hypothetical protein